MVTRKALKPDDIFVMKIIIKKELTKGIKQLICCIYQISIQPQLWVSAVIDVPNLTTHSCSRRAKKKETYLSFWPWRFFFFASYKFTIFSAKEVCINIEDDPAARGIAWESGKKTHPNSIFHYVLTTPADLKRDR